MSGSIEKIEFGPTRAPWQATKRAKIPLMEYIKITWKTGMQIEMVPSILSEGQSRDVLCGTDVATNKEASVVVKIQDWSWHEVSNGHEFGLANTVMKFCTPEFYGVHRVLYESKYPKHECTYDLSVSVVEKIAHTMENYTLTLFASPVDYSAVCLIFTWVRCVFDLVHIVCEQKKLRVSDFHFRNIGLKENMQLVLIDVEACTEAPMEKSKKRAYKGMKEFLSDFKAALESPTADASWGVFRNLFLQPDRLLVVLSAWSSFSCCHQ